MMGNESIFGMEIQGRPLDVDQGGFFVAEWFIGFWKGPNQKRGGCSGESILLERK